MDIWATPLFAALSGAEWIQIIGAIAGPLITIVTVLATLRRDMVALRTKQDSLNQKQDDANVELKQNTRQTEKTAEVLTGVERNVAKIETHSNSLTDKLVELTGNVEFARGRKEEGERAELVARTEAETLAKTAIIAKAVVEEQQRIAALTDVQQVRTRTEAKKEDDQKT